MQEEWHMNNSRVDEASDSDRGHRMLYVLTASLALAVIGMIAVAIAVQSFQWSSPATASEWPKFATTREMVA
jgi:hypothetical protein